MNNNKAFVIRIPKELWVFLKMRSMEKEISMNEVVTDCINKLKKRCDKKLTQSNIMIS